MLSRITGAVWSVNTRLFSHSILSAAPEKWNLVSSVCVQRKPVIVKEMNEMEKKVYELLLTTEIEKSLKSDWELQHEEDLIDLEKIKAGDTEKVGKKLRTDFEDEWKQEFQNMKLAARTTKDDEANNVKSVDRLLDSSLVLVVQQAKNGNRWILPQGNHIHGETLRQTGERILQELCGNDMKVQFYSNAPCGFFKYKYPKDIREKLGVQGDKVFFFKAFLLTGQIKSSSELQDHKWISTRDLKSAMLGDYRQSVEMFLF